MNEEIKNFRLNPEYVERIRGNRGLRKRLQEALDIKRYSMYDYLRDNSAMLTKYDSLYLISKEYNTPIEQLLIEVKNQNT